jgi:hypothetical protein
VLEIVRFTPSGSSTVRLCYIGSLIYKFLAVASHDLLSSQACVVSSLLRCIATRDVQYVDQALFSIRNTLEIRVFAYNTLNTLENTSGVSVLALVGARKVP